MTYTFNSPTLQAQREFVILTLFEGDNEYAIIDAGSNGQNEYALVICVPSENDLCLYEATFSTMQGALADLHTFLASEYGAARS